MRSANRSKNILIGSLSVGGSLCVVLTVFVWAIRYEFTRFSLKGHDVLLRIIINIMALFIALLLTRIIVLVIAKKTNKSYCEKFHVLNETGVYFETRSRWPLDKNKVKKDKAVLCLHGLGSSPHDFNHLYTEFEKEGVYFLAPTLPGFGVEATDLLEKVCYKDWFRQSLEYYDVLYSIFDKVDVIGHSMGGILATYIAEQRNPDKLVLTGPSLFSPHKNIPFIKMLLNPFLFRLISSTIPYFPKPIRQGRLSVSDTCDDSVVDSLFQYLVLPLNCVRQLLLAQNYARNRLEQVTCGSCLLLYGKQDLTVDSEKLAAFFKSSEFEFKSYCLENSAHNVYMDFDKDKAINLTLDFIRS